MLVKLAAIFFSMILVNNYVLVKFYGICPFLGVSKKLDSSVGMSGAVIFVMFMATAVTFPIQIFILDPAELGYLQTIVFILVIAVLVQFIEIFLKKYVVALYNSLGVYLPLITTNCCVLAVTILVVDDYGADVAALGFGAAYIEALVCSIGAGVGYAGHGLQRRAQARGSLRSPGTLQGPAHHPDRSSNHQPVLHGLRRHRRKPVQCHAVREEQENEYCICCCSVYPRGRSRCHRPGGSVQVYGGRGRPPH